MENNQEPEPPSHFQIWLTFIEMVAVLVCLASTVKLDTFFNYIFIYGTLLIFKYLANHIPLNLQRLIHFIKSIIKILINQQQYGQITQYEKQESEILVSGEYECIECLQGYESPSNNGIAIRHMVRLSIHSTNPILDPILHHIHWTPSHMHECSCQQGYQYSKLEVDIRFQIKYSNYTQILFIIIIFISCIIQYCIYYSPVCLVLSYVYFLLKDGFLERVLILQFLLYAALIIGCLQTQNNIILLYFSNKLFSDLEDDDWIVPFLTQVNKLIQTISISLALRLLIFFLIFANYVQLNIDLILIEVFMGELVPYYALTFFKIPPPRHDNDSRAGTQLELQNLDGPLLK